MNPKEPNCLSTSNYAHSPPSGTLSSPLSSIFFYIILLASSSKGICSDEQQYEVVTTKQQNPTISFTLFAQKILENQVPNRTTTCISPLR